MSNQLLIAIDLAGGYLAETVDLAGGALAVTVDFEEFTAGEIATPTTGEPIGLLLALTYAEDG